MRAYAGEALMRAHAPPRADGGAAAGRGLRPCVLALRLALVLLLLLALAAQGAAAAPAASLAYLPYGSARVGPAPVAAHHQGGLFRISDHGRVAYLFGTVHMGTPAFFPLPPEVSRALGEARRVVVELDTRANEGFAQAVARHGRYAPGDDLRRHLSPPVLAALTAALHARGISVSSMAHCKPWLVANLLLSRELERKGYRRDQVSRERCWTPRAGMARRLPNSRARITSWPCSTPSTRDAPNAT